MGGTYWGTPRTNVFVGKTTAGFLLQVLCFWVFKSSAWDSNGANGAAVQTVIIMMMIMMMMMMMMMMMIIIKMIMITIIMIIMIIKILMLMMMMIMIMIIKIQITIPIMIEPNYHDMGTESVFQEWCLQTNCYLHQIRYVYFAEAHVVQ